MKLILYRLEYDYTTKVGADETIEIKNGKVVDIDINPTNSLLMEILSNKIERTPKPTYLDFEIEKIPESHPINNEIRENNRLTHKITFNTNEFPIDIDVKDFYTRISPFKSFIINWQKKRTLFHKYRVHIMISVIVAVVINMLDFILQRILYNG